ncbi:MAG: cytochrome c biogenesis protein CcdA [bacterium]
MIINVFEWLTNAVQSTPIIALSGAFIWGVMSILLSPCHLASIPLIVGFINGQGKITTKRASLLSTLFSIGILITIALIGVITGLMGRMLGDIGPWGNYFVGGVFILVGLILFDVIPIPSLSQPKHTFAKKKGIFASFLLGLIFGIALGPCTFAYMAPMLAITFNVASTKFLYGVLLLTVYGVGHCSVIILAGTFTEIVQQYLNWNEQSRGALYLKKLCGVLVFAAGIYLLFQR